MKREELELEVNGPIGTLGVKSLKNGNFAFYF
jgi:hypothetical protein